MRVENEEGHVLNENGEHGHGDEHGHKHVKIEVDNHQKHVQAGTYVVAAFKSLVDVDAAKDLDEVIDGTLTRLEDNASVTIKGGEIFFSHVRHGGSS